MNKIYLYKFPKNIAVIAVIIMGVVFGGMISANAQSLPVQGIDAVRCGAGELTLTVSWSGETLNPDNVKWYTVPFYGTPIATGMSYTTPYLEYTQAFYVDYTGEGGCSQCTRLLIRAVINDQVIDPQISYSSLKICNNLDQNFIPTIVGASGGTYEVSPETGLTVNSTTGIFNPENATQGNYTITFNPEEVEGCNSNPVSTTVTITQALETPVISYPLQSYCSSDGLVSVTKTAGADGGTYSAYPSGLAIDAATGQINPAVSATGNYTISYTVPGTGGCAPVVGTTTVSVLKLPTAQISYTSASYTQNQGEQAIQITGTDDYLGGTFSAPEGLTINSSTGTITPSTSTAGGYTVTYTKTAVSPCSDNLVATTEVTIYSQPVAQIAADENEMCQAGTEPVVTFTGSGGTAPYTFRYKINEGAEQTITSVSGQNSVTLNHPTLVAGTFTYEVFSVSDFNNSTRTYSEGSEPGVAIQITTPQVAAFEYSGSPYCSNGTNPEPVFLNGGVAGTFSANSEGLVFATGDGVNPGTIDLIASTPGTYIVTNTIAATGGCSEITATASVTITALPLAGFSYANASYCQLDEDPAVILENGAEHGVYTSDPIGIVFLANGGINLDESEPNTYTIYNTVVAADGCEQVQESATITITPEIVISTPVFNAGATTSRCQAAETLDIYGATSTGSENITYSYALDAASLSAGNAINQATGAVTWAAGWSGTTEITVTASAPCAVSKTAVHTVTVNPSGSLDLPTFALGASSIRCQAAGEVDYSLSNLNGAFTYTYILDDASIAGGNVSFAFEDKVTWSDAWFGISTLTVTASSGCSTSQPATHTITTNPVPEIPAGTDVTTIYDGQSHTGSASSTVPLIAGGSENATIVWYDGSTGGNVVSAPSGTNVGTYTAYAEAVAPTTNCISTARTLVTVTIQEATPTVSVTGGEFTYSGSAHGATGFAYGVGGVSDVLTPAVTFEYVGTGGTTYAASSTAPAEAGTYQVTASFAGNSNYNSASNTTIITINKADQSITWSNPADIVYGTALSSTQLNAEVTGVSGGTATGEVTYSPVSGTVLDAGDNQDLTVDVAATTNYNTASKTVKINVNKATPTVSVTGGEFTYNGSAHGATGFAYGIGGVSDVLTPAVTFEYVGTGGTTYAASSTAPAEAGTYQVTASFAGNSNYNSASNTTTITINKADQSITWSNPADIVYGTALSSTQLNAEVTGVSGGTATGEVTYSPVSGTVLDAGDNQDLTVDVAATTNYNTASKTVKINVAKAPLSAASTIESKEYDGTATPGTVTLGEVTGLIGLETLVITPAASDYADANAGTGKPVTISYSLADGTNGGKASNYSMADLSTTGNITPASITELAITGITAPSTGATPVTAASNSGQFTAIVSWSPALDGNGKFVSGTVYTALITVTPTSNYTLTGVAANTFTVSGATATNSAGSGVVTAVFPGTVPDAPTGAASQTFCSGTTVASLVASGSNIKWYDASETLLASTDVLINDQKYYASQTVNGVESTNRLEVTVTANPLPTITTTGTVDAVCYNASQQTTSLPYTTTTNSPTSYSIDWVALTDQGSTSFTFEAGGGTITGIVIPAGATAGTWTGTMTITNENGCTATQPVEVKIWDTSVGGTATANASTICTGTETYITLTGHSAYEGSTIQWQKKTTGEFENISGATGSELITGTLTITTIYRAVVTNGVCSSTNSTEATVTVTANPTGGTLSPASANICTGTNSTEISLSGYTNGTVVRWESSTSSDFATHTNIENTADTYTATNLTATTYFRAVIDNDGCDEVTSGVSVLTVYPLPTITTDGTIAAVAASASLQTTTLAYTATTNTPVSYSIDWTTAGIADQGSTTITFQSDDASVTGIEIPANTAAGIYSGTMTIYTATGCTATQAVSVTVYPVAPTASSPQTFCSGATVAELVASGDGGATFKWYTASTGGSALPTTDVLSASNTYYASQTVNGVESTLRSAGISVTLNTAPTPTFTAQPGATAYIGFEVTYTTESGKSDYVWAYPDQTVITDYTIVSGGTSSDNTVTLIWNTSGSKTVTVNYTDGGCSAASATSSTATTVAALAVGATYGGGIVAYILQSGDPGYVDGETHGLIAAASDNAVSYWGCDNITVTGADDDALGAGTQNTIYIVSKYEGCDFAAKLCSDLVIGVYDDWYLPSKDELYKLYLNRTIIGGFSNALYWSSTEPSGDAYNAYTYNFDTGTYPTKAKYDVANLSRAIRSF